LRQKAQDQPSLSFLLRTALRILQIPRLATYHQVKGGDLNSGVANIVFVDASVGKGQAEDGYDLAYPGR
jgi:hypothetical protein